MFDSLLHDPRASWRIHPATDLQLARLDELGIRYPTGLTKGQAADLTSQQSEPDYEETEFLGFFGVRDAAKLNQLEARRKIADIIAEPTNKVKWANRPASKDHRELIEYVDGVVQPDLTLENADQIIAAYSDDASKLAKVEAFTQQQWATEDRENAITGISNSINLAPSSLGLRFVNRWYVQQAVAALEAETGQPCVQLNRDFDFYDRVAERIRQTEPILLTKEAVEHPERFAVRTGRSRQIASRIACEKPSNPWPWIVIAAIALLAWGYLR